VKSSDRIMQVGNHRLYDPGFAYARERIRQMRDLAFVRVAVLHSSNEVIARTIELGGRQFAGWGALQAEGLDRRRLDRSPGPTYDEA
jgi:hypothetical protein